MNTLKDDINKAIISIHREERKEWIPLKEIYAKVEEIRKQPNTNNGASIRASLEKHCAKCDAFSGKELYDLKEKGTGLYKSIYYNNLMKVESLNIGETFSRNELMDLFKVSGQAGIMKTNSLGAIVLSSSSTNGIYDDSEVDDDGRIIYTGEGTIGDQQLTKNNKTLYNSSSDNIPIYLFTKDKNKKYTFEGKVVLYSTPYQIEEIDTKHNIRKVWKFPLKVLYPDNNVLVDKIDNFEELIEEIEIINKKIIVTVSNDELVFVDEPLKVRKYRKNSEKRKLNRNSKPDYIAEEIVKTKQGIINEQVIYENEIKELMKKEAFEQIERMKEFFENKKENEGYDILSFELNNKGEYIEKYIEVKSTKGDESTPIDITDNEREFAEKHINQYYLYRVIKSDSEKRYIKVVKGIELFDNYKFIPTTYKIYSN